MEDIMQNNPNTPSSSNVGPIERWVSGVVGSALGAFGARQVAKSNTLLGTAAIVGAGALLYRGFSGKCGVYKALGINHNTGHNSDDKLVSEAEVPRQEAQPNPETVPAQGMALDSPPMSSYRESVDGYREGVDGVTPSPGP